MNMDLFQKKTNSKKKQKPETLFNTNVLVFLNTIQLYF